LATDHKVVTGARPAWVEIADLSFRTDRLIAVAADTSIATGEETQVRWEHVEIVHPRAAGDAAQVQALLLAEWLDQAHFAANLCEIGVREERLASGASLQGDAVAPGGKEIVVGPPAGEAALREHEGRVAALRGHLEIAVQGTQTKVAHPAAPQPVFHGEHTGGLRL